MGEKSDDLQKGWTRWQEPVEIATTAGKHGLLVLSKERPDPTRHVGGKQSTETNGMKNKDGTGQSGSKEHGKTNLEKTKIFEMEI